MLRALIAILLCCALIGCRAAARKKARELRIDDVSISSIPDGSYTGSYSYGGDTYTVRCIVEEGRVNKIKIISNRDTRYAVMAESVVRRVVQQQRVTVDAVAGATATSKALLKATEKALAKGASKDE